MNIYQELYKKSTFPSKCSEEVKKQCFDVWRDKRNQVFDAKRETLVYEKKDFTPRGKENKKTNKNILIKWKKERNKKEASKKKPPFVVGIVRHKIYSPPFLHKSSKTTDQKKKILRQSFAPKNYKFKPPEGLKKLKINAAHPTSETGTSSPFTFNSLFINQKQVIINKKELAFENVTVRHRAKPLIDSSPNKITPKNSKIKKDAINKKSKDIEKILCTDDTDEPPIFGKLNLLKFREKTVETNEVPDEASTSAQASPNQNINISKPEDISCASSYLNQQNQQESYITKDDSAKKDYAFKPPTLYSCSQQIQSLIEQKDLRFTELYPSIENKQKIKRTSEMPSPNISRISFTTTDTLKIDKLMTTMEKIVKESHNKGNNNSFEYSGSPINDALNITIHTDKSDVDDEALNFNLSSNPNISIPENINSKITSTDKTVHEQEDLNTYQECLLLSKIVDSPVKRIPRERILTENEDNKSKKFNAHDSLNLTPTCTELKKDLKRDGKVNNNLDILFNEEHLNGEEILDKIVFSLNDSKTLENENIETETSVLSNSNSSNEENATIIYRSFIISKENMIPKTDTLNEQKASKHTEVTIASTIISKENNIVSSENIKSGSMLELEELSPRDHNISNLESEIIFFKTSIDNDQKPIPGKNNLNESKDNFIEDEKSATVLKSELSHTLTTDLRINKSKMKNENNEKQPEIIDLSDSPLRQEKVDLIVSPPESIMKKPLNIENKHTESELLTSSKIFDFIHLVDSPKVEKELSESLSIESKLSYQNLEKTQKFVSDNCKSTIILKNNKNKLRNSQTSEIETVDLISDDEEDAESLLSHIKARFEITTIDSPKLKPERVALTSIENVLQSPRKSLHLQTILKENSSKTQNISIYRDSLCKTPQSPLFAKEHSPAIRKASPVKNLSFHDKKVDISITPKKTKNTPKETSLIKNNLSELNSQTSFHNSNELNQSGIAASLLENIQKPICKTPRSQKYTVENSSLVGNIPNVIISACASPQQKLLVKENSPTSSTAANPTRFLSLRSRKVDVTPSPKKTRNTPRKALSIKHNLPDVNGQTPKNNSEELNKNEIAVPVIEILQNSTCNTSRLVKENSPVLSVVASPLKVLSLRSRKVDVSPSPKKTRKTPRKVKTNIPDVNIQTPKNNSDDLNENRLIASLLENVQNSTNNTSRLQEKAEEKNIPILHISPCKTPQPKLLVKENSPVTNAVSSPMRILCLRSRKVDVTPSPKKKTPTGKKTPVK